MMERHITKEVQIGNRWIGGNHPIAIQSMTNTKTEDVAATVAQIKQLTKVRLMKLSAARFPPRRQLRR